MRLFRTIAAGFQSLLRRKKIDQELDQELDAFLEMAAEEKIKRGMNRDDVIRFGLRMLRKNPGFTAVAVLTLLQKITQWPAIIAPEGAGRIANAVMSCRTARVDSQHDGTLRRGFLRGHQAYKGNWCAHGAWRPSSRRNAPLSPPRIQDRADRRAIRSGTRFCDHPIARCLAIRRRLCRHT